MLCLGAIGFHTIIVDSRYLLVDIEENGQNTMEQMDTFKDFGRSFGGVGGMERNLESGMYIHI